jgi:predicted metal-dependent HD superfamily phosphohydrolase
MLTRLHADIHISAIRSLIMATCHNAPDLADDAALIADIDLAILAADPMPYRAYAAAIRAEYSFVPEIAFRPGRAAILQGLLNRPRLYFNPAAHARFDAAARKNLAAEIAALQP